MTTTNILINMDSTCSNTVELDTNFISDISDISDISNIKKTPYDILFAIPNTIDSFIKDQSMYKSLEYIFQSSTGLRIFIKSPNNIFSLCANIYGDLWIGSSYGEIRWIYRNLSNSTKTYIGEPNIIYTKKGLFLFLLDDKVLYHTDKFFDRKFLKPVEKQIILSKYHVQIISNNNKHTCLCSQDEFKINLSNKGIIII